ncbi:hypothetical protein ACFL49_02805 [Candidatus Omnitrophota bacterium]
MKKDNKHAGQSTIEYLLLFTAVIAVIMVFLGRQGNGSYRNSVSTAFENGIGELQTVTDRMRGGN